MENNEENLGSQEPVQETTSQVNSNTTKPSRNLNIKVIAIVVAIIAIVLFLFFTIFTRSAKDTVKDFIKAVSKGDEKKIAKLIDAEGSAILSELSKSNGEYNFEKFEDGYDKLKDMKKDLDKDKKKEYNDAMKEACEEYASKITDKYDFDDIKLKIKEVKTKSVKDAKGVTKVTVKVQLENDGDKHTSTLTFYTIRKGLKDYVISPDSIGGLITSSNIYNNLNNLNSIFNY